MKKLAWTQSLKIGWFCASLGFFSFALFLGCAYLLREEPLGCSIFTLPDLPVIQYVEEIVKVNWLNTKGMVIGFMLIFTLSAVAWFVIGLLIGFIWNYWSTPSLIRTGVPG